MFKAFLIITLLFCVNVDSFAQNKTFPNEKITSLDTTELQGFGWSRKKVTITNTSFDRMKVWIGYPGYEARLDSNNFIILDPLKTLKLNVQTKFIFRQAMTDSTYSQIMQGDYVETGLISLQDRDLTGYRLQGLCFDDMNLSGVNLEGVSLVNCSFRNTNLEGANFTQTNLSGTVFANSFIKDANFTDASGITTQYLIDNAKSIESCYEFTNEAGGQSDVCE